MTKEDKNAAISALEELKGDCTGIVAATIEDCQRVIGELPDTPENLYGYPVEDLARVAVLMERCNVKPKEIRQLSNNIIGVYGVIMRGIKQDFKIASDAVIMECRYPGIRDFCRMVEEEKIDDKTG